MNLFFFSYSSKLEEDKMKLNTILEKIIDDDVNSYFLIFYYNFTNSVTRHLLMTLIGCYVSGIKWSR